MSILASGAARPSGGTTYDVWDYAYEWTGGQQLLTYQMQDINDVIGSGEFTMLLAYEPDTLSSLDYIFDLWEASGNNRSLMWRFDTSNNIEVVGSANGSAAWRFEGSHGMSTNNWYFITLVASMSEVTEADRITVYVNGSDIGVTKNLGTASGFHTADYDTDGAYGGWGGDENASNRSIDGFAHEFTILDKALTSSEVSAIYNSGRPISPRDNHNANVVSRIDMSSGTWNGSNYDFDDEILGLGVIQGEGTVNGNLSSTGGIY